MITVINFFSKNSSCLIKNACVLKNIHLISLILKLNLIFSNIRKIKEIKVAILQDFLYKNIFFKLDNTNILRPTFLSKNNYFMY